MQVLQITFYSIMCIFISKTLKFIDMCSPYIICNYILPNQQEINLCTFEKPHFPPSLPVPQIHSSVAVCG